ncbi:PLP-dependent transferase [Saccharopolyspora griseoalba]|uniref:PLP-dependent transferase n=1 Tax=Saccharopolyspora griseoalba TaxID=1431848 RepID=A0ABW2LBT4_9PSEU
MTRTRTLPRCRQTWPPRSPPRCCNRLLQAGCGLLDAQRDRGHRRAQRPAAGCGEHARAAPRCPVAARARPTRLHPGVLEPHLGLRGLRTLPLRIEAAQRPALELARRLSSPPAVSAVHYAGLPAGPP